MNLDPTRLQPRLAILLGQHPVHRGTTHSQRRGNRARRLTVGVHPLRQSSLLLVKRLGSSDVLAACPTRLAGSGAAFPA